MVDCGPVGADCVTGACPHSLTQHRYEPDRERWVCTVADCSDNPYQVVKVNDAGWPLSVEGYGRRLAAMRAAHPEATFEFVNEPPPFSPDLDLLDPATARWWRRKRLGLHWWQRSKP